MSNHLLCTGASLPSDYLFLQARHARSGISIAEHTTGFLCISGTSIDLGSIPISAIHILDRTWNLAVIPRLYVRLRIALSSCMQACNDTFGARLS